MDGYGHNMSGWGWAGMAGLVLLFGVLVIVGTVLLVRLLRRGGESSVVGSALPTAEQQLKARFARGEIDETEYRSRLALLQEPSG